MFDGALFSFASDMGDFLASLDLYVQYHSFMLPSSVGVAVLKLLWYLFSKHCCLSFWQHKALQLICCASQITRFIYCALGAASFIVQTDCSVSGLFSFYIDFNLYLLD
jgi:hypothetical protein